MCGLILLIQKTSLHQKSGIRRVAIPPKLADTPLLNKILFRFPSVELRSIVFPLYEVLCVSWHSLLFRNCSSFENFFYLVGGFCETVEGQLQLRRGIPSS